MAMDKISYLYYRIKKLNPHDGDIAVSIQFTGILVIHLMPIVWISDQIFDTFLFDSFWSLAEHDDVVARRMIKLPILLFPLWLGVYLFLRHYKEKIEEGVKKFELMSKKERKRKNLYLWLYIVGSFVFLLIGISSSDWVPTLKSIFQ